MNWILPTYFTVIAVLITIRIIWWVAFSWEDEEFIPNEDIIIALLVWPIVAVILAIFLGFRMAASPFIFVRNLRLKRKQNASI